MILDSGIQLEIRRATSVDDLESISELLYKTDQFIYPYWFGSLENCKSELSKLIVEEKFFFNVNHLYVAVDQEKNKIMGLICVVDKSVDLDYDYQKLEKLNDRYNFTVNHYIKGLIKEVKESDFAYISNVCVHEDYRGMKIGNQLVNYIIELYTQKCFKEVVLDVLAENPGAIHLYKKLGFEQFTEIFKGFNHPDKEKPDVFSMKIGLNSERNSVNGLGKCLKKN